MTALRRYLAAGLLIWIPLGVTILVITFLVDVVDRTLLLLPSSLRPEALLGFRVPGLGFVLTAAIVLATGVIVSNLLGQKLFEWGEAVVRRIPLVRSVYTSVKKLTETLVNGSGRSFRRVALVEYPRPGMWTLAFITGDGAEEIEARTGREMVNVFVPTTPNPTSGFMLVVPRSDVIELEMTTDDGLRMILSFGVVVPERTGTALRERAVERAASR